MFILAILILFLKSAPGALIGGVLGLVLCGASAPLNFVVVASTLFALIHAFTHLFTSGTPKFFTTLLAAYLFNTLVFFIGAWSGFNPPVKALIFPGFILAAATHVSMNLLTPTRPNRIL